MCVCQNPLKNLNCVYLAELKEKGEKPEKQVGGENCTQMPDDVSLQCVQNFALVLCIGL